MKLAILHRYPLADIKSTNASIHYLIDRIRKEGHQVDVLTFKKFDRLSKHKKFWKSLLWILYAPLLVAGKGYDVIYCDDSYPFYPALVKLASPKSKVVIRIGDLHLMYYFSGWAYQFLHFFEVLTWKTVDEIYAISHEMQLKIASELHEIKTYSILDPVDPKDFPITEHLDFGYVMFHGVLTKNKNVDVLLEAARILQGETFLIVGDGPDRARLESIAPENVEFKGWVPFDKIPDYINGCAVGVALRSDNPGNQYVVTSPFLQYGVMGKPCLVTRRTVYGSYKWQFEGVAELVEKLQELLKLNVEGDFLREYVLENHSAEKIAEEIWKRLNL